MYFPKMAEENSVQQVIDQFGGLDRNLRISNNAFYDMHNMSGEDFPLLSTRRRRGVGDKIQSPSGIVTKDSLAVVSGSKLIYNGNSIDMELRAGVKKLVSMGAYLVIFPDKKYINTQKLTDWGSLENERTATNVTLTLCRQDGTPYELGGNISESAPNDPTDGMLWMDTSGDAPALKQFSVSSAMWVSIPTVYVKIEGANIHLGFNQYDGVAISGIKNEGLASLNGSHTIQQVKDGSIVVIGIMAGNTYTEASVTVTRSVPDMDFVTECGNRLWGCKYGKTADNKVVNEIYASKLGDFKNWNCYQGIATDSFAASRGSDGEFTGAITHLGHPLFFKENCVEKVYPAANGAHQIVTTELRGVQKGCWRSLVIVDEVLYYKSRDDVCAYTGSLPTSISDVFGDYKYSDARAGATDGLYYISMQDEGGAWHLLAYDTKKGVWHEEDSTHAMMFATVDGELYWVDEDTSKLVCRTGDTEGAFDWRVESGVLGLDIPENQYMTRLLIRAELEEGASLDLFVRYGDGAWEKKISYNRSGLRSFNVPVLPHRCDTLKLKLEGHGGCKVYSISKHITQGSEQMW